MKRNQNAWKMILALCCTIFFLVGCGSGNKYKVPNAAANQKRPTRVLIPEFDDSREYIQEAAKIGAATPLTWSRKYRFSRPDATFSSGVEPFTTLIPKLLAEDLEKAGYFDDVSFGSSDDMPEPGSYDIILKGNMIKTESLGRGYTYFLVFPLGLSIYDFAWTLGLPKYSRKFNVEVDYQWLNGYTYEPISDTFKSSYMTDGKFFTQYVNETKLEDFRKKIKQSSRELVENLPADLPASTDNYWASMRNEGQTYLAELQRQQMLIERGTPPTFTLLDPVENAAIRSPLTNIQWSVTSPNGLKSFILQMNGATLSVPINQVAMANEATAPRSIPAQINQVNLSLGSNTIRAKCEDWRDNVTEESVTVFRYPQELRPAMRHALFISASNGSSEKSATDLATSFTDPYAGQFPSENVSHLKTPSGSDQVRNKLSEFGSRIVAGELAFIYVTGSADAASNSIVVGSQKLPINDFLVMCRESVATDETVIFFDLNWNSESSNRVLSDLPDVPSRWAIGTSAQTHTPNMDANGRTVYADTLIKTLADSSRGDKRLTLERCFDIVAVDVEIESGDSMRPRVEGRYDPNITMASYE